jgi:hypothetical protein
MKIFCLTISIAVFLLVLLNGLQAQTTQTKLNQIELMKQFIGSWKIDLGKDTTGFWECKPFGTGLEGYLKNVTKGKILMEVKQLVGYDKKIDKYVNATLTEKDIKIRALWFTSNNKYIEVSYSDIANSDIASPILEGEFKSHNEFVETVIKNGKVITYDYKRVK